MYFNSHELGLLSKASTRHRQIRMPNDLHDVSRSNVAGSQSLKKRAYNLLNMGSWLHVQLLVNKLEIRRVKKKNLREVIILTSLDIIVIGWDTRYYSGHWSEKDEIFSKFAGKVRRKMYAIVD